MSATITIWDGESIQVLPRKEGEKLIKEDKAQDMQKEDGLSLKYRHQFAGYTTRELRAEVPPTPVVSIPDDVPAGEAGAQETEKPETTGAGDEADLSWEDYKAAFKAATGKKRATQAAVEQWMSEEGIS